MDPKARREIGLRIGSPATTHPHGADIRDNVWYALHAVS